jgi:hypothetical protein
MDIKIATPKKGQSKGWGAASECYRGRMFHKVTKEEQQENKIAEAW